MAFMKKPRDLPNLILCGAAIPWVDRIKHLGNYISNTMDGNQLDIKVKTAKYIDKCNSLSQEFCFAHPYTKVSINSIYNSHFTGSQLWSLDCREMEKLESAYNKSIKIIYNLPWATHRYFMESLSSRPHLRRTLVRRYLSFVKAVANSTKKPLRMLLEISRRDVRTTTGSNLRRIMLLTGKGTVEDLEVKDANSLHYHKVPACEEWRLNLLKELIDIKNEEIDVPGIDMYQLDQIINYVCTT